MKKLHLLLYPVLLCLITACGYAQQKEVPEWVKAGREAFERQEHRLEFNGCEFLYNGKKLYLNQPVSKIEKVLGKYDRKINDLSNVYIWEDMGIRLIGKPMTRYEDTVLNETLSTLEVFNKFALARHAEDESIARFYPRKKNNNYILVEGIPIKKGTLLQDVLGQSAYLKENVFERVMLQKQVDFTCEDKSTAFFFLTPTDLDLGLDYDDRLEEGEIISFAVSVSNKKE